MVGKGARVAQGLTIYGEIMQSDCFISVTRLSQNSCSARRWFVGFFSLKAVSKLGRFGLGICRRGLRKKHHSLHLIEGRLPGQCLR